MRAHFGDKVYETVIPRNVRVSEAPSFGKPALIYDLKCAGSQAYLKLARELVGRERERRKRDGRGLIEADERMSERREVWGGGCRRCSATQRWPRRSRRRRAAGARPSAPACPRCRSS